MTKKAFSLPVLAICMLLLSWTQPWADQNKDTPDTPLIKMKSEALSFFAPVSGTVQSVTNSSVDISAGSGAKFRQGMRVNAVKEGVDFIHPVTKEPMGKLESPVGKIEITEVKGSDVKGSAISGKPENIKGTKIKIPATKIRALFHQGSTDWYLGDAYYQMLKETGRFELVDSHLDAAEISKLAEEAKQKSTEIIILLESSGNKENIAVTQKLIWADDSKVFSEKEFHTTSAYVKELRFRSPIFAPREGEILLSYTVSSSVSRIVAADVNGDRNIDVVLVSSNNVGIYAPETDLRLLWEFKLPMANRVLWIDALDIKKSGKDCLLITTLEGDTVNSYIYEFDGNGFINIWKGKSTFLRKINGKMAVQPYSTTDGYDGDVRYLNFSNGAFSKGEKIKLPENVNIYDFQFVRASDNKSGLFAWDDAGLLHLYNENNIRTWVSEDDFGGFTVKFAKERTNAFVDRGYWSVKDRLLSSGPEVLVPKRKPVLGMARGLGYNSSGIRSMWWNGFSVENRQLLEEIDGDMLDYAIIGDRIYTINKSSFGIKPALILKGESPFANMLYIFSLKGRQ
ncbi:MAG: hypothetical protein RBT37_00645 [Dissulfurispiraceae bacterium]|jgi:hypothetical protein|nr:hypothetical protein [Dissulfurispiraceae bacterium]